MAWIAWTACVWCSGPYPQLNIMRRHWALNVAVRHFSFSICFGLSNINTYKNTFIFHFIIVVNFSKLDFFLMWFAIFSWTADKLDFSFQLMLYCLFAVFSSSPIFPYHSRCHFSFYAPYADFCEGALTTSPSQDEDSKDSECSMSTVLSFVHTCIHIIKYFRLCFYFIQCALSNERQVHKSNVDIYCLIYSDFLLF